MLHWTMVKLGLILVVTIVIGLSSACAPTPHQKKVQRIQAQIAKAEDDLKKTEQQLKEIEKKKQENRLTVSTAENVRKATKVRHDEFKKNTSIIAPTFNVDGRTFYLLHGAFDRDHKYFFEIVVMHGEPSQWANFYEAYDKNGTKIPLSPRPGSRSMETVNVRILHQMLTESKTMGLSLKLYGKNENLVLNIPTHYINGFLAKVQESGLLDSGKEDPQKQQL